MNPWGLLILAVAVLCLVLAVKNTGGLFLEALHK